jgi:type IV pilus assembly protein PilX
MTTLHTKHSPPAQRGIVLISALLLLIVMTIIAIGMFHGFGIQELIAGNVREKQRALQSAEGAEEYAEMWMASYGNFLSNSVDCSTVNLVPYSSTSVPYICMKPVASIDASGDAGTVPWMVGTAEVGFAFFPGSTASSSGSCTTCGDVPVSTTGGAGSYYQVPRFYIGLVANTPTQALYRIDAWNYAGTKNTPAVVESNYVVVCSACP